MKIAILGGRFDPPHVGHGMVASYALWNGGFDEVWLIPAFRHAFTGNGKNPSSYIKRLIMCRAFCDDMGDPRIQAMDVESTLPAPSYTIDTLRYLNKTYPQHSFRLIVGRDVISEISRWKDWGSIEREFKPFIVGREGYEGPLGEVRFPNVSSTKIRKILKDGGDLSRLVSPSVVQILRLELGRESLEVCAF